MEAGGVDIDYLIWKAKTDNGGKALELGETHGSGKYLFVRKWFRETFPNYKPATVDAIDAAFADEEQDENDAEVAEAINVTKIAG